MRLALLLTLLLSGCTAFYPDTQVDVDGDGRTPEEGDCDDRDEAVHPGAAEVCDGLDNDCDGLVDGEDLGDGDLDGFDACADCDDARPDVSPDAIEGCDGVDTDCDGTIPAEEADEDGDGDLPCAGDCADDDAERGPSQEESCDGGDTDCDGLLPSDDPDMADLDEDGVRVCDDCDDSDPARFPGADEICDGLDNDCFGGVPTAEVDLDLDNYAPCDGDCDETDPARFPGQIESCNGIDDACGGGVPLGEQDPDTDGWFACEGDCRPADVTINPGATEICNSEDDDCDGLTDEPDPTGLDAYIATARTDGALDLYDASGALGASFSAGGTTSAPAFPVAAADFDGDGVVSFLRALLDPSDASVDLVDRVGPACAGGWSSFAVIGVSLPDDRRIEAVGDLDGDGSPDLVAIRHDGFGVGAVFTQQNDGLGAFLPPIAAGQLVSTSLGAGTWVVPATLLDLDGDGNVDLLECGDTDHRTCRIHPGAGDGTFGAAGPAFILASEAVGLAVGDVDGDLVADIVYGLSSQGDPGAVYRAAGDGLGGFGAPTEVADVSAAELGPGPGRGVLRLSDVDGDTTVDLVLLWDVGVLSADREISIATGDGGGGFSLGTPVARTSASLDPTDPGELGATGP